MSIKLAVVLAAGLGSRFSSETKDKPKGFIKIEDKTLIEMSIEKLFKAGIERVFIGTGYLSEFYEELAKKNKNIECIKSDRYKETSSMYTLYNMRNKINEDFLLLESDLLYEEKALTSLVEDNNYKDIILSSSKTNSGDEVYIETNKKNNFLINISKNKNELNCIYSELVGISKVSFETYKKMNRYFESIIDNLPKSDYETIFARISKENNIFVKRIDNLIWCEIDDESHYRRAINEIYRKLKN